VEAVILGDMSNLKNIYKVPKKARRFKVQKTASKAKAQPKSFLKKQKRKQAETKAEEIYKKLIIRIANRRRSKVIII